MARHSLYEAILRGQTFDIIHHHFISIARACTNVSGSLTSQALRMRRAIEALYCRLKRKLFV